MSLRNLSERPSPKDAEADTWEAEDTRSDSGEYSGEAESFLNREGSSIHPIFDPMDERSKQGHVAETRSNFEKQFLEAMEAYQASMKNPKLKKLDLREKHSWDEVMQVAKEAETAYLQAGEKGFRKLSRIVTAKSPAALPFTRLIPEEYYGTVLAGGLRLVFGALSSIGDRRCQSLEALLRVPEAIFHAESCVENFPQDQALSDRVMTLYKAALTAIEGTIKWLMGNTAVKTIKALTLGPLYNQRFEDKVQTLEEALELLLMRVSTLRDRTVVRIEKIVGSTRSEMSAVTKDMKTVRKAQGATDVKIDQLRDLEQTKKVARDAMKIVLKETTRTSKWKKQKDRVITRLKNRIEELERSAAFLSKEDLLEILDVGIQIPADDLKREIRVGYSADPWASDFAKGIVQTPRFIEWESEDTSAALLVESGQPLGDHGRSSPLSLLSSSVIEALEDEGPSVTIHFFCGSHTSSTDALKGPNGVMRSLICQILRLFPVDLSFISYRRYSKQLEALHLLTLCDCFVKLVKQLPVDTVLFCIIDSINFFEQREWTEDCRQVIHYLHDLAEEDDAVGPVFKLLLTSSYRSKVVKDIVPPNHTIYLAPGGRNDPTQRQRSMASRRSPKLGDRDDFEDWQEDDYSSEIGDEYFQEFLSESELRDGFSKSETE